MRRDFAGHSGHTGSSLFAPAVMEAQPMCRHATLALPPDPASAGAARRFLRTVVGDWELAVLLDGLGIKTESHEPIYAA